MSRPRIAIVVLLPLLITGGLAFSDVGCSASSDDANANGGDGGDSAASGEGSSVNDSSSSLDASGDAAEPSDAGDASDTGDAKTQLPPNTACLTNDDCHTGKCLHGICVCDLDSSVQFDGTCGPGEEPVDCQTQDGGICLSPKTACPSGQFVGSGLSSRSCGDFVAAVCCFPTCKGSPLYCCNSESGTVLPAYCMRGWKTCPTGETPILDPQGCQ